MFSVHCQEDQEDVFYWVSNGHVFSHSVLAILASK